MRERTLLALATALIAILSMPALAQSPRVSSIISAEGVITAISTGRSSFTMRVLTPGHQRQVGASEITVLVQGGTDIHVADMGGQEIDRPARILEFQVGDRVHVEALRLTNGQFLALRVVVQNRQGPSEGLRSGPRVSEGPSIEFQGVVIDKGDRSLRVQQANGAVRTVLVTSTTDITGGAKTFREIKVGNVVIVRGTVNADGTVVARRIEVLRSRSSARR